MNSENWSGCEKKSSKNHIKHTYDDYLNWSDNFEGYELLEGIMYHISFSSCRRYRKVFVEFIRQAANCLIGERYEVYCRPFDVRLSERGENDGEIMTVVQPDIIILDDRVYLDEKGCTGSPLLIIEIISSETKRKDIKTRRLLYEKHGVREYWLVDYRGKNVEVYLLENDIRYSKEPAVYLPDDKIFAEAVDGLEIDLSLVFNEDGPYYS